MALLGTRYAHDWITVRRHRWCRDCEAFQIKERDGWAPHVDAVCAKTTPHARMKIPLYDEANYGR
jgi:hypothetical protein